MVLRLGVSVGIIYLVFRKIDFHDTLSAIRGSDKQFLFFAFNLNFLTYFFCFNRWRQLLETIGVSVPTKKLVSSFSGGIFFNLSPISTLGGDMARSFDLTAYAKKPRKIVATVLLDRLSGYVGLALLVIAAVAFGGGMARTKSVLVSAGVIVGILVAVLLVLFNPSVYALVNRLLHAPSSGKLREPLKNVHDELYAFRRHKAVMAKNLGFSLLVQITGPIATYYTAHALGVNLDMRHFFVIIPIIGAITMLPISVGGLGLRDGSMLIFFRQLGVPDHTIIAMSLLGFLFVVAYGVIGGLVYVLTVHNRRLQPHPSPPLHASH